MIGLTCGSFDYIIHNGHYLFLSKCRQICKQLIVLVVADSVIIRNKNRRPYYPQQIRASNLLLTGLVDGVICVEYDYEVSAIFNLNPDVYILGSDQNKNQWTQELIGLLVYGGISVISTFDYRIESTTNLLTRHGKLDALLLEESLQ